MPHRADRIRPLLHLSGFEDARNGIYSQTATVERDGTVPALFRESIRAHAEPIPRATRLKTLDRGIDPVPLQRRRYHLSIAHGPRRVQHPRGKSLFLSQRRVSDSAIHRAGVLIIKSNASFPRALIRFISGVFKNIHSSHDSPAWNDIRL